MFFAVAFLSNSLVPVWADALRRENDRLADVIEEKEFNRVILLHKSGGRIPVAMDVPVPEAESPASVLLDLDRQIKQIVSRIPEGATPDARTEKYLRFLYEHRRQLRAITDEQRKKADIEAHERRLQPELAVYWRKNRALKARLALAEENLSEAIGDSVKPGSKR